jgi:hypothetical protein
MVVERMRHAEYGVLGHALPILIHGDEAAPLKNLKPPNRLRWNAFYYDAGEPKKAV